MHSEAHLTAQGHAFVINLATGTVGSLTAVQLARREPACFVTIV
jgi:hypothetical protein